MKTMERPILYSTPMIQAKLAGRKTQTRRIIKSMNGEDIIEMSLTGLEVVGDHLCAFFDRRVMAKCKFGLPGDVLWPRETFRKYCRVDEHGYTHFDQEIIEFAADNPPMIRLVDGDGRGIENKDGSEKYVPWRPSIHMPKSAARIWERITDIRVERLRDISEQDAIAEGIQPLLASGAQLATHGRLYKHYTEYQEGLFGTGLSPVKSYQTLWESINGTGSWGDQYVWAITTEILSTTGRHNAGLAVSKTETV